MARFSFRVPYIRRFCLLLLLLLGSSARAELILLSTSPETGVMDAPAHGPFTFMFNNPVRSASFVASTDSPTIQLSPTFGAGGAPLTWAVQVSQDRKTVRITPSVPLVEGRTYRLLLSRKGDPHPVRQDNPSGTILAAEGGATNPVLFSVKDAVAPSLASLSPSWDAPAVPVNASITFSVSEPLDPESVRLILNGEPLVPLPDETKLRWRAVTSLMPSTTYTALLRGKDHAGNLLQVVIWQFATSSSSSPDTTPPFLVSTVPIDGAVEVAPDFVPSMTFSEGIAPSSVRVWFGECEDDDGQELHTWITSAQGKRLAVPLPALEAGPTCYELRVFAEDWAGNPLLVTSPLGNRVRFTTRDETGPTLEETLPVADSTIDPAGGPDLSLRFSEPVRTTGADAPVLRLEYESGDPPPALDPRDAVDLGNGRWSLEGQGWNENRHVTLRVLHIPNDPDDHRYRTGDRLLLRLESGRDSAGNLLREGAAPNPWSFRIAETRTSELLEITPEEGVLAALDAPVQVRFSLPMDPFRLRFEADGDWSLSATELFAGSGGRFSPRRWIANSPSWSADRRTATLRHAPFEESQPGASNPHTLTILLAPDAQGKPASLNGLILPQRTWRTAHRPRIASAEFLAPADPARDLTATGLLSAPTDPNRAVWQTLDRTSGAPVLPLNTLLRVHFTLPLAPLTLGPPEASATLPAPFMDQIDSDTVQIRFAAHLPADEARLARDPYGALAYAPFPASLTFSDGYSLVGDSMLPDTLRLPVLDLRPPLFRVEYLKNAGPGGSAPPSPDWQPLGGAVVPTHAPLRVVADEALAAEAGLSVERSGSTGPDPAAAGIEFSERQDADGLIGNAIEILWREPLLDPSAVPAGQSIANAAFRFRARDLRALPGPNVTEQTVSFFIALPHVPGSGDFDGDGDLDVHDVTLTLNAFLTGAELSPETRRAVDMVPAGGDGQVDATDLNALMRRYLEVR